jgi:hypothetical protein
MVVGEAVRDLRYLLDRGYPRESALNFVANHFRLDRCQRHLLARCVFSWREAREHRRKLVGMKEVRGKWLAVDGYNVLITVEAVVGGEPVVRCDDGIIRDLSGVFGKYRIGRRTWAAVEEIIETIERARPARVTILFDSQVSRSGELAGEVARRMEEKGLNGEAGAERDVDRRVAEADVSASSDRGVIGRARSVWDLPACILRRRGGRAVSVSKMGRIWEHASDAVGKNRRDGGPSSFLTLENR